MNNKEQIDRIVTAEIPRRQVHLLRELVRTLIIHSPYGT